MDELLNYPPGAMLGNPPTASAAERYAVALAERCASGEVTEFALAYRTADGRTGSLITDKPDVLLLGALRLLEQRLLVELKWATTVSRG